MRFRTLAALLLVTATTALAQGGGGRAAGDSAAGRGGRGGGRGRGGPAVPATGVALPNTTNLVELEMMTWPEVKRAINELGKTTALVYNGGTETRGPQNVNGGHTLMARAMGKALAEKLGNAIVAPILAYSTNNSSPDLPGTIGLTGPTFMAINREIARQLVQQGFKNVMLMGDHGGGQQQLDSLAKELESEFAAKGAHIYYVKDAYAPAQERFDMELLAEGLPCSSHAGIPDTSEMMYLGLDKGWVRPSLVATALGSYATCPGQPRDSVAAAAWPRVNNGITGDARKSSVALGKRAFDMNVEMAAKMIQGFLAAQK